MAGKVGAPRAHQVPGARTRGDICATGPSRRAGPTRRLPRARRAATGATRLRGVSGTEPAAVVRPPARTAAIWAALDPLVTTGTSLNVLDVGGGSGMFAVPLAQLGQPVTVVAPSADALATPHRRPGPQRPRPGPPPPPGRPRGRRRPGPRFPGRRRPDAHRPPVR